MLLIENLSKNQKEKFPEFIKKWTDIGLSTEPANRAQAEEGIRTAYKIAGREISKIVWCTSPLAQGLTRAIILKLEKNNEWVGKNLEASVRDSVWDSVRASVGASVWASVGASVRASVRDSVWASVRDSVWASVRDSVWDSVGASVRASVGASVRASVGDSVWASVGASVRASVRDSVGASVRASVRDSVWASVRASVGASVRDSVGASVGDSGYGQHDAEWLSFYDYFKEVCKLDEQTQKLTGIWQISKNAGWWLPHEKICWVSERHNKLHRDERGRLHNLTAAALTYPDGWGVYAIHGVRVPEKYILTPADRIDPKEVLQEQNAEIRMAVIKKCGFTHFLKHLKSKIISSANGNSLLEFNLDDNLAVRGLHVTWQDKHDKKDTVIPVPRTKEQFEKTGFVPDDIDDCEQVRRWTLGLDSKAEFVMET